MELKCELCGNAPAIRACKDKRCPHGYAPDELAQWQAATYHTADGAVRIPVIREVSREVDNVCGGKGTTYGHEVDEAATLASPPISPPEWSAHLHCHCSVCGHEWESGPGDFAASRAKSEPRVDLANWQVDVANIGRKDEN